MSYEITKNCVKCGQGMAFDPLDNSDLCLDCAYDDNGEPDGPEEGDWTTTDHKTFCQYQACRDCIHVPEDADWRVIVKARMEKDQFWPNVWFISDHGNAHLMQMEKPDDE